LAWSRRTALMDRAGCPPFARAATESSADVAWPACPTMVPNNPVSKPGIDRSSEVPRHRHAQPAPQPAMVEATRAAGQDRTTQIGRRGAAVVWPPLHMTRRPPLCSARPAPPGSTP
jgi:hypothetical protein